MCMPPTLASTTAAATTSSSNHTNGLMTTAETMSTEEFVTSFPVVDSIIEYQKHLRKQKAKKNKTIYFDNTPFISTVLIIIIVNCIGYIIDQKITAKGTSSGNVSQWFSFLFSFGTTFVATSMPILLNDGYSTSRRKRISAVTVLLWSIKIIVSTVSTYDSVTTSSSHVTTTGATTISEWIYFTVVEILALGPYAIGLTSFGNQAEQVNTVVQLGIVICVGGLLVRAWSFSIFSDTVSDLILFIGISTMNGPAIVETSSSPSSPTSSSSNPNNNDSCLWKARRRIAVTAMGIALIGTVSNYHYICTDNIVVESYIKGIPSTTSSVLPSKISQYIQSLNKSVTTPTLIIKESKTPSLIIKDEHGEQQENAVSATDSEQIVPAETSKESDLSIVVAKVEQDYVPSDESVVDVSFDEKVETIKEESTETESSSVVDSELIANNMDEAAVVEEVATEDNVSTEKNEAPLPIVESVPFVELPPSSEVVPDDESTGTKSEETAERTVPTNDAPVTGDEQSTVDSSVKAESQSEGNSETTSRGAQSDDSSEKGTVPVDDNVDVSEHGEEITTIIEAESKVSDDETLPIGNTIESSIEKKTYISSLLEIQNDKDILLTKKDRDLFRLLIWSVNEAVTASNNNKVPAIKMPAWGTGVRSYHRLIGQETLLRLKDNTIKLNQLENHYIRPADISVSSKRRQQHRWAISNTRGICNLYFKQLTHHCDGPHGASPEQN